MIGDHSTAKRFQPLPFLPHALSHLIHATLLQQSEFMHFLAILLCSHFIAMWYHPPPLSPPFPASCHGRVTSHAALRSSKALSFHVNNALHCTALHCTAFFFLLFCWNVVFFTLPSRLSLMEWSYGLPANIKRLPLPEALRSICICNNIEIQESVQTQKEDVHNVGDDGGDIKSSVQMS